MLAPSQPPCLTEPRAVRVIARDDTARVWRCGAFTSDDRRAIGRERPARSRVDHASLARFVRDGAWRTACSDALVSGVRRTPRRHRSRREPPVRRMILVGLGMSLAACSSSYHPEYHPVSVNEVTQNFAYPVTVNGGPAPASRGPVYVTPGAPAVVAGPPLAPPPPAPPPPGFFAPE